MNDNELAIKMEERIKSCDSCAKLDLLHSRICKIYSINKRHPYIELINRQHEILLKKSDNEMAYVL